MQTFIIAGCGYLGLKVARQLLSENHCTAQNILPLISSQSSVKRCHQAGLTALVLDLDTAVIQIPSQLRQCFSPAQPIVFYFIPPPPNGDRDPRAKQFIAMMSKMAALAESEKPAKIVLISTTGVYGNCHGQWVNETTPLNPQLDRAKRRVDAEQQFQDFCQAMRIPLVILRVAGIYGPDKLPLQRLKEQKPVVCEKDSPYSNRIHSDDLVNLCLKAALEQTIQGIYNCADGNPTTMYDYFMHLARYSHLPEPPVISLTQAYTQLSPGMLSYMSESRRIDNSKLLRDFNMKLKYPNLKTGLAIE